MRVLVCGGRDYEDQATLNLVLGRLHRLRPITLLIHGDARGADKLAGAWAKAIGLQVKGYPADWAFYGNRAGPVRNSQMLRESSPDLVVAFLGGPGTRDMMRKAQKAGVRVLKVIGDQLVEAVGLVGLVERAEQTQG